MSSFFANPYFIFQLTSYYGLKYGDRALNLKEKK